MRSLGRLPRIAAAALAATAAWAQTPANEPGSCRGLPLEGRAIRKVELGTPYDLLHLGFVRKLTERQLAEIKTILGPRYSDAKADAAIAHLEGDPLAPPASFGPPISGSVVRLRSSGCEVVDGTPSVDLEFYFIPARIPTFAGFSLESREKETTDGAVAAGVAPRRAWFSPSGGYSASTQFFGGLSAGMERPWRGVQSLNLEANASGRMQTVLASAAGSYEAKRPWLQRAEFQAGYEYRNEPALDAARMQAAGGFAEYRAASAPLGGGGTVLRYGFAGQAGLRQGTGFAAGGGGVAPNTRLGSLTGFAGVTRRDARQALAVSYAGQAARTGRGGAVDYTRHFLDAAHSWWAFRNHHPIEIDTRFSLGQFANLCRRPGCGAPAAERFFAGNLEQNLLRSDAWMIRRQPLIRSLPFNSYGGAALLRQGGEGFRALNLTAGFGVWRKTLIPEDLLRQKDFMQRIDILPETATRLLASAYANEDKEFDKDPGVIAARGLLANVRQELNAIRPAWDALASSVGALRTEEYESCTADQFDVLPLDLDDVEEGKKRITLLGNRTSTMALTIVCLQAFSTGPGDPLGASAARLRAAREEIERAVEKTAVFQRARAQADRDMAIGKNTVRTLFHEANLISVSPVFAFDAAVVRPATGPAWRYGVGGGGRVTVLSTVRLTLGYAVNVRRQPGEGRGALFFELTILDLFGR